MTMATKMVKGKKYLYFTYYDKPSGKKKEVYCGSNTDGSAKRKALELELEYVKNQTNELSKRKEEIEKALDHWINDEIERRAKEREKK